MFGCKYEEKLCGCINNSTSWEYHVWTVRLEISWFYMYDKISIPDRKSTPVYATQRIPVRHKVLLIWAWPIEQLAGSTCQWQTDSLHLLCKLWIFPGEFHLPCAYRPSYFVSNFCRVQHVEKQVWNGTSKWAKRWKWNLPTCGDILINLGMRVVN